MSEVLQKTNFELNNWSESAAVLETSLREKARKVLTEIDYPITRQEAWKYTRVAKLKKKNFEIAPENTDLDISNFIIPGLSGTILVFVNGLYSEKLSQIKPEAGISVEAKSTGNATWTKELEGSLVSIDTEFFNAVNTLYATDGVAVKIAKNADIFGAIQILQVNTGNTSFAALRHSIVCEDFAKAHLVFSSVSLNATETFSNTISEIFVGTNANLKIDKIQSENNSTFSISTEEVSQGKDSVFTINTITIDGALVRNNLHIAVEGQNSVSNLNGAYILKGNQVVDNHTVVDHKVAHCESHELYKGVIDEQATGTFNGKVYVRPDAQKINAFQSNGNVLLSDTATINSKPELEIYADDVKCSHGSTTGQLDEEAVFYLRARGLSEISARALLVSAFIGDVLEKIECPHVQIYVRNQIASKFSWEL